MTNFFKSLYISAYVTALVLAVTHSLVGLTQDGIHSFWLATLIATVPSLGFFVRLFLMPIARTSANLVFMPLFAAIGTGLSFLLPYTEAQAIFLWAYGVGVGLCGSLLYIFWYSKLGRTESAALEIGKVLPNLNLLSSTGSPWSSSAQLSNPALFLFFRGNWCPLCMAQIKEISEHYQALESMGVDVYLVSPQPDAHTKALANKFQVNFNFMVDEDNAAAKTLGIDASHGTPKGMEVLGYDSDTVLPTAILLDAQQKVIMADQTNNYRVRPEPKTFIDAFRAAGIGQPTI
jgi:peroxiredoxin